jgi:glycyl-tRNA synthetase beta chain
MGRYYADLDGEVPEVGCAIEEHYRPAGASDEVAASKLGALLAVADRVDTLVGCFAIGQAPKGNADPFGLRRAALGILRTALEGPIDVDLDAFVAAASKAFAGQPKAVTLSDDARVALDAFFDTRVRGLLRNDFPQDVIAAAIGAWRERDGASVRDLRARAQALETLRGTDDYAPLAIAFKRAFNIAGASHERGWDESLLEDGTERALASAFARVRPELDALTAAAATDGTKYAEALALVARELKAVVDQYFDDVLVMAEDEAIRANRLAMLGQIAGCVSRIAHFHVLEGQETEGKSS